MEQEKIHMDKESSIVENEKKELWFSSLAADDSYTYDADKAFEKFQQRTKQKHSTRFHIPTLWYRVAVVALVLIACATSYWQGERQLQNQFADMTIEAPLGSKSKLLLPDGTQVWLNAGSKIVYSQGFGVKDRHLQLNGEAYFEVTKNEKLPFDVQTKELNVTVLGTKFNFRNYDEDGEVVVNLLEGKVQLDNHLRNVGETYLCPTEKMILNKATGEMTISRAKVANAKEWTNDRLFFDEMPLADIAKELMRSYNVRVSIKDEHLKETRFYALFNQREQTIQDILNILAETGKLRYTIKNDTISLYAN